MGETQVQVLVQQHLEQQATVAAYQDCFMLVMLLCLASMPLLLLMRRPRPRAVSGYAPHPPRLPPHPTDVVRRLEADADARGKVVPTQATTPWRGPRDAVAD